LQYLRGEQKFGSIDLMKAQLNQDKQDSLNFVSKFQ